MPKAERQGRKAGRDTAWSMWVPHQVQSSQSIKLGEQNSKAPNSQYEVPWTFNCQEMKAGKGSWEKLLQKFQEGRYRKPGVRAESKENSQLKMQVVSRQAEGRISHGSENWQLSCKNKEFSGILPVLRPPGPREGKVLIILSKHLHLLVN